MKLFAYLALIGMGSTSNLPPMGLDFDKELDGLENLLDISLSRWAGRRIERKSRAMGEAWEQMQRPTGRGGRADREYFEKKQKEIFGWTFEDKYREINPEGRYMPVIGELMGTKEFREYNDYKQTLM